MYLNLQDMADEQISPALREGHAVRFGPENAFEVILEGDELVLDGAYRGVLGLDRMGREELRRILDALAAEE